MNRKHFIRRGISKPVDMLILNMFAVCLYDRATKAFTTQITMMAIDVLQYCLNQNKRFRLASD